MKKRGDQIRLAGKNYFENHLKLMARSCKNSFQPQKPKYQETQYYGSARENIYNLSTYYEKNSLKNRLPD